MVNFISEAKDNFQEEKTLEQAQLVARGKRS